MVSLILTKSVTMEIRSKEMDAKIVKLIKAGLARESRQFAAKLVF